MRKKDQNCHQQECFTHALLNSIEFNTSIACVKIERKAKTGIFSEKIRDSAGFRDRNGDSDTSPQTKSLNQR